MQEKQPRIGVVMVVQNDAETIERCLRSFYDHATAIVVSTDPSRGWSGAPVTQDDTVSKIRAIDTGRKVEIISRDFCRFADPLLNETYQRQYTADVLHASTKGLDWICQIDADEEFLDFSTVRSYLGHLPKYTRCVRWCWISLFKSLAEGGYLVVCDEGRAQPALERFYLAHRPGARLVSCRLPAMLRMPLTRQTLRLNQALLMTARWSGLIRPYPRESIPSTGMVLHHSFAKSERRIEEKLRTWGHSREVNAGEFLEQWRAADDEWRSLRDLHPTRPGLWPTLRPYSRTELEALFVAE